MAFKTAAEMFGDGGGFGPAVPYSTSNPPGTSAGNRGIQFGEQLTASIANRTHYALALNDEDLNTRVAVFEADGLDAAYRGGALATPGSGRVILKDGDAVETVSAHATLAVDNTHFRANSVSDAVGSSLGFEFVGKRAAGDGQSGSDPTAGLLDRRVLASATGYTKLKHNEAAVLNPTGALPTTVRIPGGQFHVGGATDLARNYDLVQISGSTSSDGLYIFSNIGLAITDAVLEKIDGTAPVFPVGDVCTISVYRVRLGSFGAYSGRSRLYNTTTVGMPQALSAMDIVAGANNTADLSGGSLSALRVMRRGSNGSTFAAADFDLFGRANWTIPRSSIPTDYDKNVHGGGYATRVLAQESGMAGHQVEGRAAVDNRFDFTSLQEIDLTAYGVTPFASALNFTPNSPLNGEVLFSSAPSFEFDHFVPGVGSLVSILNTAGAAADGLYWIHSTIVSAPKGFYLRCLDGSVPSHFPVFGAFTVGRIYAGSVVGRRVMIDNPNPVEAGDTNKPVLASVLTSTNEVGATALGLVASRDPVGFGERSLIRGYQPAPASTDNYREVFKVGSNGNIHTVAGVFAGAGVTAVGTVQGGAVSATTTVSAGTAVSAGTTVTATTDVYAGSDFRLTTPVSKRLAISLLTGLPVNPGGAGWSRPTDPENANRYFMLAGADDARLIFSLNPYLRDGMLLDAIRVLVLPGAARTVGAFTGEKRTAAYCVYVDANFSTPLVPSRVLVADVEDNGNGPPFVQVMTISCGAHVVDRVGSNSRDYFLVLKAGDNAAAFNDFFYGVELEVTDEYVRNV